MRKNLLLLCLLPVLQVWAGKGDDEKNIVLSDVSELYRFDYVKSDKSVEVKEESNFTYTCLHYRDKGLYYEFFDDQSSLDGVELYENGKKGFASKELKDYSVEDIFYSDAKLYELTLNFPQSGWQNQVRLKKTVKDPRYFCNVYFSEAYPVVRKEVVVVIPRWMKSEIKEYNFEGYDISKTTSYDQKNDADVITYIIKNLPARKNEDHQPGPSYLLPHLLFLNKSAEVNGQQYTYFGSLKDQYAWYYSIVNQVKDDQAFIKTRAQEITAGISGDMEKVKAVLYWVHNNIRYVAFEDGIAGFKPDEAQDVLNKKYGDCKGMANLTRELLRSLGFDARLAWIGTNHIRYDYSTPALCVDNHMICCLLYKGNKYFLDGTESYLPFNLYAERIQGRQVLVEDGRNFMLERIPSTSVSQNLSRFHEVMAIKDNRLEGDVEYLYRGESKEGLLTGIHASKKEALNTQLETYITNNNKNYLVSQIKTSDIDQTEGDLSIKFHVQYEGGISAFGNEMYIDIDYNKTFNQALIDTSRKSDYCFSYKHNYQTEVELALPEGYKLSSLPSDLEIEQPGFQFSVQYKLVNNTIQYKKQIRILNAFLKKDAFSAWNKAIEQLSAKYLDQIILTKK